MTRGGGALFRAAVAALLVSLGDERPLSGQPVLGHTPAGARRVDSLEQRYRGAVSAESLSTLHRPLARNVHVAGTRASLAMADHLHRRLAAWGFSVETHEYQAWLSSPRRLAVTMTRPSRRALRLAEADAPNDPAFVAYSASGVVDGLVVYVNYGLPADYARLDSLGIAVEGRIALARYGRSHRAVKVHSAQARGALGLVLYSDPADDGSRRGPTWPAGPWRNGDLIQRGNAKMSWFWHGDPLTPATPALPEAPRLDPGRAPTLPRIPVVALSAEQARPLLGALGGAQAPADWQGGLRLPYRVGPGPTALRLEVAMENGLRPIRNVVATLRGRQDPDRLVMLGTHHDAWTFGGVDPGTGVAALLETARGFAALARQGWRPRRSIAFAFWDAEEYGLIGSTEYAEQHRERLQRELVAYLNTDMNMVGRFDPGGVPSLRDFVVEVARGVEDDGRSVFERWRQTSGSRPPTGDSVGFMPALKPLGSGADFVPFQDHLGVPTLSLEFIGENGYGFGTYHSSADSRRYVERFADPGFRQGAVLSRLLGTAAIRLAESDVLPFRFTRYAQAIGQSLPLGLDTLRGSATKLERAAARLEGRIDSALALGGLPPDRARRLNDRLQRLEQLLTDDDGHSSSRWYRHVLYGWNIYSLYDGQPLPGYAEAVRLGDHTRVVKETARIGRALQRLIAEFEALVEF